MFKVTRESERDPLDYLESMRNKQIEACDFMQDEDRLTKAKAGGCK